MKKNTAKWKFWIDRGGTFTDIIAVSPQKNIIIQKLLSDNPDQYQDAAIAGMRQILNLPFSAEIPSRKIAHVKMGTTVATNALLERKGEPLVLVTTQGFGDVLKIGYQNRPDLFALEIKLPKVLYEKVIEIEERISATGEILVKLDPLKVVKQLKSIYQQGYRTLAIVLMHGYRYPQHEKMVEKIAKEIGFTHLSVSHKVIPLVKFVSRGDTTVVDAYLSPILYRYIKSVRQAIGKTKLLFMQSNGGLAEADFFHGKNSILSGPAGGVVGMVKTSVAAGFQRIIGFDMGGTSTDVSHFAGNYERTYETEVAGVRLMAPMMKINTIAAGGGSIIHFDGLRFTVGPDSAGANPGPACYRRSGPLTITDCNLLVGKIQAAYFPKIFGKNANEPLDEKIVRHKFKLLAQKINRLSPQKRTPEQVAAGFLAVAIDNMANAIKKISIQRGYDLKNYILNCFGAAAGQHGCMVADALGIKRILIHSYAGVLSAYGIGMAEHRTIQQQAIEAIISEKLFSKLKTIITNLAIKVQQQLIKQGIAKENISLFPSLRLRYQGTDTTLFVPFTDLTKVKKQFIKIHKQQFGFTPPNKIIICEAVVVEAIAQSATENAAKIDVKKPRKNIPFVAKTAIFTANQWHDAYIYKRNQLMPNDKINGVAIIIEDNATTVIEPGWQARVTKDHHLILTRSKPIAERIALGTQVDPILLEIFNNRYMAIAEQMGEILKNTTQSINIRERLDFSCAIFNQRGDLIANAPHIPVHLGSMSESVKAIFHARKNQINPGDIFMLNAPYHGGTHLPDITVITPVFDKHNKKIIFFVASRGHHADIGGITPGSMPAHSKIIQEEGIVINNFQVAAKGKFLQKQVLKLLTRGAYPARNPQQNIADFQAQIAANEIGRKELLKMVAQYGLEVVHAYMDHVRENAAESVRRMLTKFKSGRFSYEMDNGQKIKVKVTLDKVHKKVIIDFTGTSKQQKNNFNAPAAITKAAIIYVMRCLVDENIPLNSGCLQPVQIIIPRDSMLNPKYPAAVVAGNVETSQVIVDCLFAAFKIMAAAQGTMNNLTLGNEKYQYYETICGGAGAGKNFNGASAVHTHMTNTRLTDPEIFELRFPVIVHEFSIRRGSGGQGKFQGGDGVLRRIKFIEKMQINILSNRRRIAPIGLQGGHPGKVGKNFIWRFNGIVEPLKSVDSVIVNQGDELIIETPGGGGFGRIKN